MRSFTLAIAIPVALAVTASSLSAQSADASPGAQEIAQLFTKQKDVSKQKYGVTAEKFAEVTSVPVVLDDALAYAGHYEDAGFGVSLDLRADGGELTGSGTEPTNGWPRKFTLDRIRISGGLLTARKRYEDGTTRAFEAAFLERSERDAPNAAFSRRFGLGMRAAGPSFNGVNADKLFYERS